MTKLESVIKKIQKRIPGVTIYADGRKYWFTYGGKVASFLVCEYRGASSFHIRHEDDHSDSMTDYFAGSFYDNATQMINTLCPPPPKFPTGALIRGKDTKRANRLGVAGRVGIVESISKYGDYLILWCDNYKHERYAYERDLELVSEGRGSDYVS